MKKDPLYRQCRIVREHEGKTLVVTSWIPDPLAMVGKEVFFKDNPLQPGTWEVKAVGSMTRPQSLVRERQRAHAEWRKATDV